MNKYNNKTQKMNSSKQLQQQAQDFDFKISKLYNDIQVHQENVIKLKNSFHEQANKLRQNFAKEMMQLEQKNKRRLEIQQQDYKNKTTHIALKFINQIDKVNKKDQKNIQMHLDKLIRYKQQIQNYTFKQSTPNLQKYKLGAKLQKINSYYTTDEQKDLIVINMDIIDKYNCATFRSRLLKTKNLLRLISHIQFHRLTQLILSNSMIQNIEALSFLNVPLINDLSLDNNNITNLKVMSKLNFKHLKHLRIVQNNFNDQELTSLQRFRSDKNLTYLQIQPKNEINKMENILLDSFKRLNNQMFKLPPGMLNRFNKGIKLVLIKNNTKNQDTFPQLYQKYHRYLYFHSSNKDLTQ